MLQCWLVIFRGVNTAPLCTAPIFIMYTSYVNVVSMMVKFVAADGLKVMTKQ